MELNLHVCESSEFYCCVLSEFFLFFVCNCLFTIALWEFGCFIESVVEKNEVIRELC